MEEQAARAVSLERAKLEELSVRHETFVREATAAKDKVEAEAARVLQVGYGAGSESPALSCDSAPAPALLRRTPRTATRRSSPPSSSATTRSRRR